MRMDKQLTLNKLIREYNEETEVAKDGWIIIKIPFEQFENLK